jgi:hypothetical protein
VRRPHVIAVDSVDCSKAPAHRNLQKLRVPMKSWHRMEMSFFRR